MCFIYIYKKVFTSMNLLVNYLPKSDYYPSPLQRYLLHLPNTQPPEYPVVLSTPSQ